LRQAEEGELDDDLGISKQRASKSDWQPVPSGLVNGSSTEANMADTAEQPHAEDGEIDEEGEVTKAAGETQKELLNQLSKRRMEISQQGMAFVHTLKINLANNDGPEDRSLAAAQHQTSSSTILQPNGMPFAASSAVLNQQGELSSLHASPPLPGNPNTPKNLQALLKRARADAQLSQTPSRQTHFSRI
jgi:hypothetical protein